MNERILNMNPGQTAEAPVLTPLVVSIEEASKLLGISVASVRREIDRGKLRPCRLGRRVMVRRTEIDAYLRRCES